MRRNRHHSPLAVVALTALLFVACASEAPAVVIGPASGPPSEAASAATSTVTPPATSVTIAAVGDLMFARDITTLMQEHGVDYPFARVRPLLEGVDLLVGNMEGTFTTRGTALSKTYTFRTPPDLARTLTAAGFDAVALGNNHTYDFGEVGLLDTLAALQRAGVPSFGAGANAAAARAPLILEARGLRIALLSYSGVDESGFAAATTSGVARAEVESVRADVQQALAAADFTLVFLHVGIEYQRAPSGWQQTLAHAAIDAGADVVVGSHPHVLQASARRGDGLILYSLGNFVFDLDTEDLGTFGPPPFETAVAVITLSRDAPPAVEFRPAFIDPVENRPRPATAEEAARIQRILADENR